MNKRLTIWVILASLFFPVYVLSQEIDNSAQIVLSSGANLVLTDMGITQSGTGEISGTGAVILGGTAPVVLENSGTNDLVFYDLEIDNSGGVTLNDPIEVTNSLNLVDGIVDANVADFNLGNSANTTGGSNQSHVEGNMVKTLTGDFEFPLGDDGYYQYLRITDVSSISEFRVSYTASQHPEAGPYYDGNENADITEEIGNCDHWDVEKLSGTGSANVVITYGNNPCNVINSGGEIFLSMALWDGLSWNYPLASDPLVVGEVATTTPLSLFGGFALASNNPIENILPIELLEFNAEPRSSSVLTSWTTASEINNDYFVVEKSADGDNFVEVGRIDGAGNSTIEKHYQLTDPDPYDGLSYYRLKQVDFNGEFSHSQMVAVHFNQNSLLSLDQVYRCDDGVCVAYHSDEEMLQLDIRDVTGRLINQTQFNSEGSFISLPFDAARGIYILTLRGKSSSESMRFFY